MKPKVYTDICDCNGELIPYGAPVDFTWWEYPGYELELHLVAKIRKRKDGDIFEFIKDDRGRDCHFTHRLTSLNWCSDDLELLNEE
jgi:hypothetical protein